MRKEHPCEILRLKMSLKVSTKSGLGGPSGRPKKIRSMHRRNTLFSNASPAAGGFTQVTVPDDLKAYRKDPAAQVDSQSSRHGIYTSPCPETRGRHCEHFSGWTCCSCVQAPHGSLNFVAEGC